MPRMSRSRQATPRESGASRAYDGFAFFLLLLPVIVGLAIFGGAVWWVTGPLAALAFLAVLLLVIKPFFFPALRQGVFRRPPGWLFFLTFLIYTAIRIPFSAVPFDSLRDLAMAASCVAAYWGWTRAGGSPGRIRFLLGILLIAGCGLCLYAWMQHVRGSNLVLGLPRPEQYGMRASATYGCPNHFAHVLNLMALVALGFLVTAGAGWLMKGLSLLFLIMGMPMLVLTGSRSGWIGLTAGLLVMFSTIAMRGGLKRFLLAVVLLPALLGLTGLGVWSVSPTFRYRVQNAIETDDARYYIWRDTLDMIQAAPMLGHGPGTFRWIEPLYKNAHKEPNAYARYAHNEPLHLLAEYGAIGAVLLGMALLMVGLALFSYARKAHRNAHGVFAAAALGGFSASLAHALFDFNFHISANNHVLVLILGLVMGRMIASGRIVRPVLPIPWAAISSLGALACLLLALLSATMSASYGHSFFAIRHRQEAAYDEALHHAQRAVAWFPFYADGHREVGSALLSRAVWDHDPEMKKEYAAASLDPFEKAAARNAYDLLTRFSRSRAYSLLGDEETSLALLREITAMAPRQLYYLKQYGLKLRMLRRHDEAWDVFQRARALDRRDTMVQANLELLRSRVSMEKLPPAQQRQRRRREREAARAAEAAAQPGPETETP